MDLNAIKFGGSSSSLPDDVRRHRTNNRLCMACGQPSHWKDAHDPKINPNPLPIPPRQPPLAAADSLTEGMVTADGDVGSDTETHPRDFLSQYSPSQWSRTRTIDQYSVPPLIMRPVISSAKYPLAHIHHQRPTCQDIPAKITVASQAPRFSR
jgi:hypothetical protein